MYIMMKAGSGELSALVLVTFRVSTGELISADALTLTLIAVRCLQQWAVRNCVRDLLNSYCREHKGTNHSPEATLLSIERGSR
jgi:hypothetical protein